MADAEVVVQGYLAALAAAFFFGVQYVPVKKHEIYDGTVFQWFMCSGVLFTGVLLGIVCAGEVPRVAMTDLLGGMFWTAQNMLLMPVVKLLGLGLGFAIYSATNVLSGYAIGRLGLFGTAADPGRLPWLRDCGAACLVASFALMVLVRPPGDEDDSGPQIRSAVGVLSRAPTRTSSCPEGLCALGSEGAKSPGGPAARWDQPLLAASPRSPERQPPPPPERAGTPPTLLPRVSVRSRVPELLEDVHSMLERKLRGWVKLIGFVLVVLAGFLNSVSAIPMNWWLAANKDGAKGSFVFAQALGVWMVSTALYLSYASGRRILGYPSPPHTCIRPAFLSGFLWAFGFVCMCLGVSGLGFTAGYTYAAVLPVAVSSLISVFWFREIRGRAQILLFVACFTVQSVGVCLIALGSH